METKKILYIHAGSGKTGTTAIQKFIENNENWLSSAHGFQYLKTGRSNSKHRSLDYNARRKLDGYHEKVDALLLTAKDEIYSSKGEIFLISDEDFLGISPGEIKQIHDIFSPDILVKAIVYLRRQDEFLESWFGQIVKTGEFLADINNLYARLENSNVLNYPAILSPWEDEFGLGGIVVRPYEFEQFINGCLFDDFMAIFGLSTDGCVFPEATDNTSLTRNQILLLRNMAKNGLGHLLDKNFIEFIKTVESGLDSKYVLSKKKRTKIVKKYELHNKNIAERYLNKKVLFKNALPMEDDEDWVSRSDVPGIIYLEVLKYLDRQ